MWSYRPLARADHHILSFCSYWHLFSCSLFFGYIYILRPTALAYLSSRSSFNCYIWYLYSKWWKKGLPDILYNLILKVRILILFLSSFWSWRVIIGSEVIAIAIFDIYTLNNEKLLGTWFTLHLKSQNWYFGTTFGKILVPMDIDWV